MKTLLLAISIYIYTLCTCIRLYTTLYVYIRAILIIFHGGENTSILNFRFDQSKTRVLISSPNEPVKNRYKKNIVRNKPYLCPRG